MNDTPSPPSLGLPMVYLVDDEDVVRHALSWLLRTRRLLSEGFASAEDFLAMLDARADVDRGEWPLSPSCLLLDMRMPGMSGLALFDLLRERGLARTLPVIFLTGHGDVPTAVATVQRGAFDFVEKPFSDNALVDRTQQALDASHEAILQRQRREQLARRLAELTQREREVMDLVIAGRPNKLIADALAISVRTVEVHRARVFDKMGVASAVALANLVREAGPA